MPSPANTERYTQPRLPVAISSHGGWLYYRCCLSYRDGEERLFVRGVLVTDAAIHTWCRTCGHQSATHLRRRRSRPGEKWHLDAGCMPLNTARSGAGRGAGGRRARHPRAKPPHPAGHKAVLPQAPPGPHGRPTGDHHGPGAELGRGQAGGPAWGGARPAAHAPAGAADAGRQSPRPGTTISRRVWANRPPLWPPSAALGRARIPAREAATMRHRAGHPESAHGGIRGATKGVMPLPAR
jgi:hypothetical protein